MAFDLDDFCRRLTEDAPDAIVYADAEGVIRFWNRGAAQLFGWSAAEAVGRSLDIIIPERLRARHWEGWRQVMATGKSRYAAGETLAVPGQRKDGTRVSLEFTILPFSAEGGGVAGMAAILRDVSKRFEELQRLRRELAGKPPQRSA
jgi:PAS domain S-box-containing protein